MPDPTSVVATDEEQALSVAAAELDAVQAVLARLDDGTFDRCEVCGGSIGSAALQADPLLARCPAHSVVSTAVAAGGLERTVAVFAGDQPLALGGEQPQS